MSYLHHPLMLKATIRSYFHVHRTARWLQEQRFSPSPLTPRHKGILSLFAGSVGPPRAHRDKIPEGCCRGCIVYSAV